MRFKAPNRQIRLVLVTSVLLPMPLLLLPLLMLSAPRADVGDVASVAVFAVVCV